MPSLFATPCTREDRNERFPAKACGAWSTGASHPCWRFEASCLDQGPHCRPLDPASLSLFRRKTRARTPTVNTESFIRFVLYTIIPNRRFSYD